jgi:phenylalanyl-tRNA synthetase beta chain
VREVSRFPQVHRDLALTFDRSQPAAEVLAAIERGAGAELVSAELYDRYEGEGIAEGRVSLAFRLVFQRADRTLQDAEVNRAVERLVRMLAERFGGELR